MEELVKQLKDVEQRMFTLEMKDTWDKRDFELSDKLEEEKERLEKEIYARQNN